VSGVTTALNQSCACLPVKVCERGVGVNGHVGARWTVTDVDRRELGESVAVIGSWDDVANNAVSVRIISPVLVVAVRAVVDKWVSE